MKKVHLVVISDPADGSLNVKAYSKRQYADEEAARIRFYGLYAQATTVQITK